MCASLKRADGAHDAGLSSSRICGETDPADADGQVVVDCVAEQILVIGLAAADVRVSVNPRHGAVAGRIEIPGAGARAFYFLATPLRPQRARLTVSGRSGKVLRTSSLQGTIARCRSRLYATGNVEVSRGRGRC